MNQALKELTDIEQRKKTAEVHAKRTEPRASSTDPEARVMKMADGGFRPAYNVQCATSTDSQIIVGVEVSNLGSDLGQLTPMLDAIERHHGQRPGEWLVDGGYPRHEDIESADERGTTVYAPVPKPKDPTRDPHVPRPEDSAVIGCWRARMGTAEAKRIYTQRAAMTPEVNAIGRICTTKSIARIGSVIL